MARRIAPWFGLLLLACAGGQKQDTLRSPSYDYPQPGPTTADGEPIGADGRDAADTLGGGVRVSSEEGPKAPGWSEKDGRPQFDPKDVKGGNTSAGSEEDDHSE